MQGQQVTEWLTAKEAAQHLKVKTRTMLMWVRQGKVKGYALSGTRRRVWRFLRSDLNAKLIEPSVPCGRGAQ
jgi:excisionase family DNA binding protein